MSFFRYPGGKAKFAKDIIPHIPINDIIVYQEPFFGGGSIGTKLLATGMPKLISFRINDKDIAIYCIWRSVTSYKDHLIELIKEFQPTVESYYDFKDSLNELESRPISYQETIDIAFKKIALHQMSFSGLGVKSGGPIGGLNQTSRYKVDCRWSPESMIKKINKIHSLFENHFVTCTNYDFREVKVHDSDFLLAHTFSYLDPPYFEKGNELYQHGFSEQDHVDLSNILKDAKYKWLLSYDDCDEIRDLYSWASIDQLQGIYTIKNARNRYELLIKNY